MILEHSIERLHWAEAAVKADWAGPEGPGPGLLPRLEARQNLALLAEDRGEKERAAALCSAPFDARVLWEEQPGEVQIAAARLAIRRTREAVAKARSLAESKTPPDSETLASLLQDARNLSVPLLQTLLAHDGQLEGDQREKLAGLLGYAYGALAWGYELFDKTRCAELFESTVALARAHPGNAALANGLTFALLPLMPEGDADREGIAEVRRRIAVFTDLFERLSGEDDANWQVNSVGCLAALTAHMPEEEAVPAAMKVSQRLLDWSASAWVQQNVGYAVRQVAEALFRALQKDRPSVEVRLLAVFEAYRAKTRKKSRATLAGYLSALLARFEITGPLRDTLAAELCDQLESAQEAELIESFVPNLVEVVGKLGAAHLVRFWKAVREAAPLVRQFWLAALAFYAPELLERDVAEEHLRNLRDIHLGLNEAEAQDWIGALNTVTVALIGRETPEAVRETLAALAADPSCPIRFWLDTAGLALIDAGRAAPEWLADMLKRVEAAASAEPVDPALRAGLSYFITGAIFECAASRANDLARLTQLLGHLTAPGAKREEDPT